MFAWPSSSWITRKSAPCSSRCVAKLCRSMCGVMLRSTPARRTRFLMCSHKRHRRERRAALRQKNIRRRFRRDQLGPPDLDDNDSTLQQPFRPTGTTRSLLPLPMTLMKPASRCSCSSRRFFNSRQAQAGSVGQFQNRLVAQAFRRFRIFRFEQFFDFVVRQRLRQPFPAARQRKIFREVRRQDFFVLGEFVKRPQRRDFQIHALAAQAARGLWRSSFALGRASRGRAAHSLMRKKRHEMLQLDRRASP